MKRNLPALLALLALALPAVLPAQAAEKAPSPLELMHEIDGVYKKHPENAQPNQAGDVIELVPHDDDHLYLSAHLDFANGGSCDIAGMARFEHGAFVYRDPAQPLPGERPCALRLHVTDKKLVLTDRETPDAPATCKAYCGARGDLDYEIGREARQPIAYLDRLKRSKEYRRAVQDLRQVEKK